jgi:hypothetical protein
VKHETREISGFGRAAAADGEGTKFRWRPTQEEFVFFPRLTVAAKKTAKICHF